MRHLPYEEKLQRLGLQADLITAFKIFLGLLDFDPDLFSSLPIGAAYEGTTTKYTKV